MAADWAFTRVGESATSSAVARIRDVWMVFIVCGVGKSECRWYERVYDGVPQR